MILISLSLNHEQKNMNFMKLMSFYLKFNYFKIDWIIKILVLYSIRHVFVSWNYVQIFMIYLLVNLGL